MCFILGKDNKGLNVIVRTLFICLFLFSIKVSALNFNNYCAYNKAEQDCSSELLQAIIDASASGDTIELIAGSEYRIDRLDTSGFFLQHLSIVGGAQNKPVIHTDGIQLFDINNLSITNVKFVGINNEDNPDADNKQSKRLVIIGSNDRLNKATNISIEQVDFENAAEDLLVLWNVQHVEVKQSTFRRTGLAMRIAPIIGDPNDIRPRGSGLLFHNVIDANVSNNEFYEIKKVAIFIDGEDMLDENIAIFNNHIDMLNFEKPTKRYGLKGGAGIYFGNANNTLNAQIYNNRIMNYKMNGMRINGTNFSVSNNAFNYSGECDEMDNSIAKPLVGMAIKAHFLVDAKITGNCIQNTHSGFVFESWQVIENVNVNQNTIYGAKVNFWIKDREDGISSNINTDANKIKEHKIESTSSGGSTGTLTIFLLIFAIRLRNKLLICGRY